MLLATCCLPLLISRVAAAAAAAAAPASASASGPASASAAAASAAAAAAAADIRGCCLQAGDTPLICAAYYGRLEVVRMLLGAGAVVTATNHVSGVPAWVQQQGA
jgi:ankyrin repeat protein